MYNEKMYKEKWFNTLVSNQKKSKDNPFITIKQEINENTAIIMDKNCTYNNPLEYNYLFQWDRELFIEMSEAFNDDSWTVESAYIMDYDMKGYSYMMKLVLNNNENICIHSEHGISKDDKEVYLNVFLKGATKEEEKKYCEKVAEVKNDMIKKLKNWKKVKLRLLTCEFKLIFNKYHDNSEKIYFHK